MLKELLESVDKIEEDETWMREEYETARDYCRSHQFKLSAEDQKELKGRGLYDFVEDWKMEQEQDS